MKNEILFGDCLEVMKDIPDGSVDMILCDLPYGTTQCKWDSIIPFELLWEQYKRVTKKNAAIVLTAAQPFTSALIMSNVKMFKYDWVWCKSQKTGQLNAKKRPLVSHESVLVFYKKQPHYKPYSDINNPNAGKTATPTQTENYGKVKNQEKYTKPDKITKNSIISGFIVGKERGLHPTQKPIALFEYLIKTYTNEGETVLDNCAGSFTTAVACNNLNREWICIEQDPKYCQIGYDRLFPDGPWVTKNGDT